MQYVNHLISLILIIINIVLHLFGSLIQLNSTNSNDCDNILFIQYLNTDIPESVSNVQCDMKELYPNFLTENEFHYSTEKSFLTFLEDYDTFLEESDFNERFHEIECNETNCICYQGIVHPYKHDIYYNTNNDAVIHRVTGIRE